MKTIILFYFLLLSISITAQEVINYPDIDKKTYSQYLKGDWKELIKTGKISLKNEIDFYYLQVRMGIAYYELKKYRQAISYFEKARKLNAENELVTEYLYYSYLFSGRTGDARKLIRDLPENLKTKIGVKANPIISAIGIELRTENYEGYKASDVTLQQNVKKDYLYFSFGVEHLIKNSSKIFWSFSRININSSVFDLDELNEQVENDGEVNQNQFYFSYQNQLKYGLNLVLAANLLNVAVVSSSSSGDSGSGRGGNTSTTTRYVSNEIVGYLGLRKDLSNFQIGFNTSVSNLNKNFQIQPGIDFTFYPFANTNLYLSTNANYQLENKNNQWENEPVVKQSIGFRLLTVYFEPSITFGNITNYTENNAFIINNDYDIIKNRYEFLVYGYFFKNKLNLFFKYQNYNKTNTYFFNGINHEISYQNQTLTGGIKWNF